MESCQADEAVKFNLVQFCLKDKCDASSEISNKIVPIKEMPVEI